MLGKTYDDQVCSIARVLELVGERWSILILRDAIFRHFTRFSEFERSLGIAPNILAKRLESFVEAGLFELRQGEDGAGQPRYLLTERGRDFVPLLMAATAWGDKWVGPGPVRFIERESGAPVELVIEREDNRERTEPAEVGVQLR